MKFFKVLHMVLCLIIKVLELVFFSNNLLSAVQLQAQLEDKICKEIREGRVMGPFSHPPMPNIHISPIGLVPKSSGGWRMITHLSYPPSQGINFFLLIQVHAQSNILLLIQLLI